MLLRLLSIILALFVLYVLLFHAQDITALWLRFTHNFTGPLTHH